MVAWSMIAWRQAVRSPPVDRSISVSAPYFCAHWSFSTSSAVLLDTRQVTYVGGDDEPAARHLIPDDLESRTFPGRHPSHLRGDQPFAGRFELRHRAFPPPE